MLLFFFHNTYKCVCVYIIQKNRRGGEEEERNRENKILVHRAHIDFVCKQKLQTEQSLLFFFLLKNKDHTKQQILIIQRDREKDRRNIDIYNTHTHAHTANKLYIHTQKKTEENRN